ncbi:Ste24 endopeptidase [Altererythrobacter insulae]|nr:Ste24 endopeptidase [Altererythrobacter insulae]
MTFNAEAATQVYMDRISAAELLQARAITTGNHWLLLVDLLVAALVTWVIIRSNLLGKVSTCLTNRSWALRTFTVAAVFALVSTLLTLPYTIYKGWWRMSQYGLISQPLSDYFAQRMITSAIDVLILSVVLLGAYWLMRTSLRWWWIWSAGLVASVIAFMAFISPALIDPLFNSYEPVPEGEVRDAVIALAANTDISADRIFMYDASRQSNTFNANVSGIGPSARVAFTDVAISGASLDEVLAVTGHELGHYALKHTAWDVVISGLLYLTILFLIDRLYGRFASVFGSDVPLYDIRSAPVVMFMLAVLMTLSLPIQNNMSRVFENQADDYSLEHAGKPDAIAEFLIRGPHAKYPKAGPIEEYLFYTHPAVENRIRKMMEWKAAHLPEITEVRE